MARQHASDGMAAAGRGGGERDGDQLGFGVLGRSGLLLGYYLVIAFRKIYIGFPNGNESIIYPLHFCLA
jgi:hypothetical protein